MRQARDEEEMGEVVRVLGTLMWIISLSILFGMLKYLIKTKKMV